MTEQPEQQPSTALVCPACGSDLARATVDLVATPDVTESLDEPRAEFQPGEMVAVDFCPNPDCVRYREGPPVSPGAVV